MSDGDSGGSPSDDRNEDIKVEEAHDERYVPRFVARGQFPSTMSNFPTQEVLEKAAKEARYEPSGWWDLRETHRPWREKPYLKRQSSVAPEQTERLARKKKVL